MSSITHRAILKINNEHAIVYEKSSDGRLTYVERIIENKNGELCYRFGKVNVIPNEPVGLDWIEVK